MQSQHKIDINHNYRKVKKIKFGRYLKKKFKDCIINLDCLVVKILFAEITIFISINKYNLWQFNNSNCPNNNSFQEYKIL